MAAGRGAWGTRFGFYLAAIGSAFGLGNIWRFPYIVSENGGGAFVLLYVFLVFLVGMPFLIGELMLGKVTRSSVLRAMNRLQAEIKSEDRGQRILKRLSWVGTLSMGLCLIVLAYYAVISGWVLHFLTQFTMGFVADTGFQPQDSLRILLDNGWLQVLLTSVHLLVVVIIVAKDVEEGIERWVGYMMPIFGILLLSLAFKAISLPTAPDALRFLFYPDFSSLTMSSLGEALGHVFFTLSIGFGTMVTFGSYLNERVYIPIAGFRVATIDSFLSLFAGVLIFPLVLASLHPVSGPELLFRTVPVLLSELPGGGVFGLGFFICLYLAALGASIGLLETIVSNTKESLQWSRTRAAWAAGLICFLFALLPALSSTTFQKISYNGKSLIEILDAVLINWGLPIAALAISQVVLYFLGQAKKRDVFFDPMSETSMKLYSHWEFVLRWIAVPIILLALILQIFDLF